jgi:hypothetical protein
MRPNTLALALALAFVSPADVGAAQESAEAAPPGTRPPRTRRPKPKRRPRRTATVDLEPGADQRLRVPRRHPDRLRPALQAGLTYTFGDSGIYVGGWTSNVDFADPTARPRVRRLHRLEPRRHDEWNLDLSLVHYSYFGERDDYGSVDYTE